MREDFLNDANFMRDFSAMFIKTLPVGAMLPLPISVNGRSLGGFVIKDEAKYLSNISTIIETKFGIVTCDQRIEVGVLMLRLTDATTGEQTIYESYLNYKNTMLTKTVDLLSVQETTVILLVDSEGLNVKSIGTKNHLRDCFLRLIKQSEGKSWSMAEFDEAKAEIQQSKGVKELWEDISRMSAELN